MIDELAGSAGATCPRNRACVAPSGELSTRAGRYARTTRPYRWMGRPAAGS
jgi:hypothetical protein